MGGVRGSHTGLTTSVSVDVDASNVQTGVVQATATVAAIGIPNVQPKTFWRFRRNPAPGVAIQPENFSACTATQVKLDWLILKQETSRVVVVARHQELSLRALQQMAPNLAHWSLDYELQKLVDSCSSSGEADDAETTNRDRLGRRKRIPVLRFVDELMADRLGLSLDTITTYRQRGSRSPSRVNRRR